MKRSWLDKLFKRNWRIIGINNHEFGVSVEPMGPYTKKLAIRFAENLTGRAECMGSNLRFYIQRIKS